VWKKILQHFLMMMRLQAFVRALFFYRGLRNQTKITWQNWKVEVRKGCFLKLIPSCSGYIVSYLLVLFVIEHRISVSGEIRSLQRKLT
jgi:hypothetical protein